MEESWLCEDVHDNAGGFAGQDVDMGTVTIMTNWTLCTNGTKAQSSQAHTSKQGFQKAFAHILESLIHLQTRTLNK